MMSFPSRAAALPLQHIDAAIFDMDGLLIDSEPFWKRAERESFAEVGIDITEEMAKVTASMTTSEVASYWYAFKPWKGRTTFDLELAVMGRVRSLIDSHGNVLPGARELLGACRERGWPVALASNSPLTLCEHVLRTLKLDGMFDVVLSADQVPRGKPAPDIYLEAARRLVVPPARCIAFEDSVSGVRAARAAGVTVIGIPSAGQVFDCAVHAPSATYASLKAFWQAHFFSPGATVLKDNSR